MLETMLKMNSASAKQDLFSEVHRPPPPPQGQGIVRSNLMLPWGASVLLTDVHCFCLNDV
jgi:hypothetical protein